MGLDHSTAFVRLVFDGLIAFCFNKRELNRCELGMVQVDDHKRKITIFRINPNSSEVISFGPQELTSKNEIIIEAANPVESGAFPYPRVAEGAPFDRVADKGDPEDFRWIIDLQGNEFHGSELKLKHSDDEEDLLRPRIYVPHGIFYTYQKTCEQYFRRPRKGNTAEKFLGKLADKIGADLVCNPGTDVIVKIADITTQTLSPTDAGFRYRIEITNLCDSDPNGIPVIKKSDFPNYYKVAVDNDGIQFDLKQLFSPGDPRGKTPLAEFLQGRPIHESLSVAFTNNLSVDGPPQVCNGVFLSGTNKIQ